MGSRGRGEHGRERRKRAGRARCGSPTRSLHKRGDRLTAAGAGERSGRQGGAAGGLRGAACCAAKTARSKCRRRARCSGSARPSTPWRERAKASSSRTRWGLLVEALRLTLFSDPHVYVVGCGRERAQRAAADLPADDDARGLRCASAAGSAQPARGHAAASRRWRPRPGPDDHGQALPGADRRHLADAQTGSPGAARACSARGSASRSRAPRAGRSACRCTCASLRRRGRRRPSAAPRWPRG